MNTTKEKFTDKQLRIIQIVVGILCAAALIVAIYVAALPAAKDNKILQYLFLVVFLIIMIGRRKIEAKFRIRLNLFNLVLIDGILAGIMFYTYAAFYYPSEGMSVSLNDTVKILIIVGIALLLLILGIMLPLSKYNKRKINGTVAPIRLPEEPEPEEKEEEVADEGPLTIEQKISQMTKELDDDDIDNK